MVRADGTHGSHTAVRSRLRSMGGGVMTELTAQQERKRAADRAFARRRKAGSEGRNPALVDGDPQPLVRISLLVNPLPRVPGARSTARPDLFFSSDAEANAAA